MYKSSNKFIYCLCVSSILVLASSSVGFAENNFYAGPLFDEFALTLDSGHRTEAVGPLFYDQEKDSEKTWALPPFFSHDTDPAVESREDDFLYPLVTYECFGKEYRWQLIQMFTFSGGKNAEDSLQRRFTIFPFYFQQRSPETNENYTAVVPFYGHLQNRLFLDRIYFVMFPLYCQTQRRDVVTDNYLFPFFHLRHGDGLRGWQFWPLVGNEHKNVTTSTNGFGDVETIGGHDEFFALWPVYFNQTEGIGTDDPEKTRAVLPFYCQLRSPKRDSTSVLWPFFTWTDDRGKKYREWDSPWPFIVFARGEGKTTTRIFPLFSRAHDDVFESDFYLWPLYKYNRIHSDPLDQKRTRILFYLFSDQTDKNTETGKEKRRVDLWPLFTWHRDFNGNNWLQILAPVEPMLPNNRGVERNWSPLWSLWRSENNLQTGAGSRSLLWNLYRRDMTPASRKCSLLFGLFQYQSDGENREFRLFYIPVFKAHEQAK